LGEQVKPEYKKFVIESIQKFFPDAEILAFGSRVKGTALEYSDLDVAIKSQNILSPIEWARLEEVFEESDLPYKIDLVEFSKLDEDFKKIILSSSV